MTEFNFEFFIQFKPFPTITKIVQKKWFRTMKVQGGGVPVRPLQKTTYFMCVFPKRENFVQNHIPTIFCFAHGKLEGSLRFWSWILKVLDLDP